MVADGHTEVPRPAESSWLHEGTEVRPSSIEGLGLFATEPLSQGTVIARLGGRLVTEPELSALIAAADGDPEAPYIDTITVQAGWHLVLPAGEDIHYSNHSCDPSAWHVDAYTIAARRDIEPAEELTVDYATQSGIPEWRMDCRCGASICRGELTGRDWMRADLQERYGEHWVPLLLDLIRESESLPIWEPGFGK